jgi:hypothetical protein
MLAALRTPNLMQTARPGGGREQNFCAVFSNQRPPSVLPRVSPADLTRPGVGGWQVLFQFAFKVRLMLSGSS